MSVVSPKTKGFSRSFEVLEDVHIYRYGLPVDAQGALDFVAEFVWCFLRTTMKTVRVAVAGRGFDVLHVCNPAETYWPLAQFWKRLGRRFVLDHHDLSPKMHQTKFGSTGGLTVAALHHLERKTSQTAGLVVTTNESHKRIRFERGGMGPDDVHVMRSGPDLERLTVYPPRPGATASATCSSTSARSPSRTGRPPDPGRQAAVRRAGARRCPLRAGWGRTHQPGHQGLHRRDRHGRT